MHLFVSFCDVGGLSQINGVRLPSVLPTPGTPPRLLTRRSFFAEGPANDAKRISSPMDYGGFGNII